MACRRLRFSLSSYWHIGSGVGAEAVADAQVLRDGDGLPLVPGRTVKGLLREAMELATRSGRVAADRPVRWFGSCLPGVPPPTPGQETPEVGDVQEVRLEEGRFSTHEGALWFGSACLSDDWRQWARRLKKNSVSSSSSESENSSEAGSNSQQNELDLFTLQSLFTYVASTAIDSRGVAREHSLRVSEVTVPMDLTCQVRGPDDDLSWVEDLRASLPLLRALGKRRSRGYGRVEVTMEEDS